MEGSKTKIIIGAIAYIIIAACLLTWNLSGMESGHGEEHGEEGGEEHGGEEEHEEEGEEEEHHGARFDAGKFVASVNSVKVNL